MVKRITYLILLLAAMYPLSSTAQNFESTKKLPQIGAAINLSKFPATDFYNSNRLDQGFSLLYWTGINNKVDYSVRYNGIFTKYSKTSSNYGYINELEASIHGRLMNDNHLLQPFASLGLGLGGFSKTIVPYLPVGLGLQLNMFSEGYLLLQANYIVSSNTAKLDNNMFYSLAYTVPLFNKTIKAKVATPPAPAPKVVVISDRDGDGIADKDDKCPDVAGVAKYQGCPIPDTDGDGVNDEDDQCPTVAGSIANHGCPEVKAEIRNKVELNAKNIYFTLSSDELLSTSFKSLDEVADILKEDMNLKLDVSGHTDNTGEAANNKQLSEKRAKAVYNYLISKGVDASRLSSEGFGQDKPVADNKTEEGRTLNRRVELKLRY